MVEINNFDAEQILSKNTLNTRQDGMRCTLLVSLEEL